MWFEILPSAAIVAVMMAVPGYALYGIHKLVLGNAYRRCTDERWHRMLYTHDRILDPKGNPYKVHGLENIPDN